MEERRKLFLLAKVLPKPTDVGKGAGQAGVAKDIELIPVSQVLIEQLPGRFLVGEVIHAGPPPEE